MTGMTRRFAAYKRLTRKYRSGWSHLDEAVYIGTFKQLQRKLFHVDRHDENRIYLFNVITPKGLKSADVRDALYDSYEYGCKCEHDCCGHWFGWAFDVKKIKPNEWSVKQSVGRNI